MDGEHARRGGGEDVVVDAVADVGDLARRQAQLGDDAGEERRVGLRDAPVGRGRDEVAVGDEVGQRGLGAGGLVAREPDPHARRAQPGQRAAASG